MNKTALVITSIAGDRHPILMQYAKECSAHNVSFIVIGDTKSPINFDLPGCEFFSIERQNSLGYSISVGLPTKHYARKNLGYLFAYSQGNEVIVETDDDNIPLETFWSTREREHSARIAVGTGWTNVYSFFSQALIWPRGFALDQIQKATPKLGSPRSVICPVQQGLADDNPDVDAIYRLTLPLPVRFNQVDSVGLQKNSICPFNSQNTTWFEEAFPLLYLPSFCSFRMTDIWRSFVAQRIMWACNWTLLFHNSTVRQDRNDHSLLTDFEDEVSGYLNNHKIMNVLSLLNLREGAEAISDNLFTCYEALVANGFMRSAELTLVSAWIKDIDAIKRARKY